MSNPKFQVGDWVSFKNRSFFKNYYRVVKVNPFPAGEMVYTLMCLSTKYLTTAYEDTIELISPEKRTLLLLGADLYE